MGAPRKQRSKFSGPSHPWNKARIDEEKEISRDYGFRNKSEIWKVNSLLRNFRTQAKQIIATRTEQAEKEKELLLKKLRNLGILNQDSTIESVLGLTMKDILERRLQSVVYRKGLARTMLQARQMIVHEHICVGENKITSPGYLVRLSEEGQIKFCSSSSFEDEMHPERVQEEKLPKKPEDKEEKSGQDSNKKEKKETKKTKSPDKKKESKAEEKKEETPKKEESKKAEKSEDKN